MAEIYDGIGLPPGVVNVVTAEQDASEALVRHHGIDKIAFTGSSAVGKRIASIQSDRVGRSTLELGGKSAALVLDDFDIAEAATSLTQSMQVMSGHVCACLTRVVVSRALQHELLDAMKESFEAIKVGDPFDSESGMGPLAMLRQRERVESYMRKGQQEGARLVTGGGRPSHLDRGYFVEPTLFGDVDNKMTIAREEIFGPVLSVIPADSEEHAISIANNTPFGLNAAVFTTDTDHALAVARRLRSGTVGHNGNRTDMSIGFGGFKESGVGREGGVQGVSAYLESKTIVLDGIPGG